MVKTRPMFPIINPHPPSPQGWVPPLPRCGRGASRLYICSPSLALRERVPSVARRVRASRYQVLGSYHQLLSAYRQRREWTAAKR